MPWLSIVFGEINIENTSPYIPNLTIFDSNGVIITDNARHELPKDPTGVNFPWYSRLSTKTGSPN